MQMNLNPFKETNLFEAGTSFFNQLKVPLNSNTTTSLHLKDILKDKFKSQELFEKVSATCFLWLVDSSVFDDNLSLFDDGNVTFDQAVEKIHADYEGMMIFAMPHSFLDRFILGLKESGKKVGARYPITYYQNFQPEFPPQYEELGKKFGI